MHDLSVIMPTYNEKVHLLKTCVESVLKQTFKEFEFIIVIEPDEMNIDYLEEAAAKDGRIRIIRNRTKTGVSGSRNVGINHSRGEYISLIDGDDYCALNRFEKQLRFLKNNPDVSVVGSNMHLVDEQNNIIGERRYPETYAEIKKDFLLTMPVANPTVMMRKKDIRDVGLFNSKLTKAEDFELWLRFLAANKKMHNMQEKMVYYRVPAGQNEKRGKVHWENNYSARKKYARNIWPLPQRIVSLVIYYGLSRLPDIFLDMMFRMNLSLRVRNIKINQIAVTRKKGF